MAFGPTQRPILPGMKQGHYVTFPIMEQEQHKNYKHWHEVSKATNSVTEAE